MNAAIIILTIISIIVTLKCLRLIGIIERHTYEVHTIMHNVWQLQDKYNIPDEVIRDCFILDNEN